MMNFRLWLLPLVAALDPLLPLVAQQAKLVDLVPRVIPAINLTTRLNVSFDQPAGGFAKCSTNYSYGASSFTLSDLGTSRPSPWEARSYREESGLPGDLYRYSPAIQFEAQPSDLHAVLMVNPLFIHDEEGGPFFQHLMILNVPGGNLSAGDLVNPYLGPENRNTTYDAYTFLLYRQSSVITLSPQERQSIQTRTGFELAAFVVNHKLGDPEGINWMFVRMDEWSPVQQAARTAVPLACLSASTLHQWVALDYDVPAATKQAWIANKTFIKENNCLTGIKFWKGEVYVTVPRWRPGVPSTLNKVVGTGDQSLLQPFPSVWFNDLANPAGVRYVQSMEIDTKGRMWILDTGRLNFFSANSSEVVNGPAFLLILNMTTQSVIHRYEFPASVAPYDSVFLNDIVVDQLRDVAYISDTNTNGRGALIVYDLHKNRSFRFQDPSMLSEQDTVISVNGVAYPGIDTPMDGIALSPDTETLYYSALRGVRLYSMPTQPLRAWLSPDALTAFVTFLGEKASQSDGMTMTAGGLLVFGALSLDTVYTWAPWLPLASQSPLLAPDSFHGQWPDTLAFDDDSGSILFTTNRLQRYFFHTMDFSGGEGANFRVQKVTTGDQSYLSAQVNYVFATQCPVVPACDPNNTGLFITVAILGGAVVLLMVNTARLSREKSLSKSRKPLLDK